MVAKNKDKTLEAGRCAFGTLITSPSPHLVPVMKNSGLDFVFIDTEHIALDRMALSWMCHAYAGAGLMPLVRISSPDPIEACKAWDGGAGALLAPYIETRRQVLDLVGATKYKPVKGEKLEALLSDQKYPVPVLQKYLDGTNASRLLLINIESAAGINNLTDLISVSGVDGVVIGPHDLSYSLDVPEDYNNPVFYEAVEAIIKTTKAKGLIVGMHYNGIGNREYAWKILSMGVNLWIQHCDLIYIAHGIKTDLRFFRDKLGYQEATSEESINI